MAEWEDATGDANGDEVTVDDDAVELPEVIESQTTRRIAEKDQSG